MQTHGVLPRKKSLNFAYLRLQQDWKEITKERYTLDDFTVEVQLPTKSGSTYKVNVAISAPKTIYKDKPYFVRIQFS